jgi:hypothetical protein
MSRSRDTADKGWMLPDVVGGSAGKAVVVNTGEDGFELVTPSAATLPANSLLPFAHKVLSNGSMIAVYDSTMTQLAFSTSQPSPDTDWGQTGIISFASGYWTISAADLVAYNILGVKFGCYIALPAAMKFAAGEWVLYPFYGTNNEAQYSDGIVLDPSYGQTSKAETSIMAVDQGADLNLAFKVWQNSGSNLSLGIGYCVSWVELYTGGY